MAEDRSNTLTEVLSSGTLAPEVIQQLKEELTCSICLDVLRDPRILPCYHSFCKLCLISMGVQTGEVLKCPYCSRKFYLEGELKDIPPDCRTNAFLRCIKASTQPDTPPVASTQPDTSPEASTQSDTSPVASTQSDTSPVASTQPDTSPVASTQSDTSPVGADTEGTGPDRTCSPHEDIELSTLCPLCKWTLNEPRLLTCGHSCCTRCLERMLQLSPVVDCPTCGVKSETSGGGILALPIDGERLLEVLSAESPLTDDAIHLDILNEESEDEDLLDDSSPLLTHEETPDTSSITPPPQPASSVLTPLREYRTAPVVEKPMSRWEIGLFILCCPFALPGMIIMAVLYGCCRLLIWIFRRLAEAAP